MKKLVKKIYTTLRVAGGMATSRFRMTPEFIIIGVQKGGTTSMFNYLSEHPSIRLPWKKQIHFFDLNFKKGISWYKGHFPFSSEKEKTLTGESSPYYVFHPLAPKRLSETYPNIKLIVLLRDPVGRAYSHYSMVKKNENGNTFEKAIELEEERLNGEEQRIASLKDYDSWNHQTFSYLNRGKYDLQLKRWLKYFKREQLLVLKSESFFENPQENLNVVHEFLNIPSFNYRKTEKVWKKGKYDKIEPATRRKLETYFASHVQKLKENFGIDFGWFK